MVNLSSKASEQHSSGLSCKKAQQLKKHSKPGLSKFFYKSQSFVTLSDALQTHLGESAQALEKQPGNPLLNGRRRSQSSEAMFCLAESSPQCRNVVGNVTQKLCYAFERSSLSGSSSGSSLETMEEDGVVPSLNHFEMAGRQALVPGIQRAALVWRHSNQLTSAMIFDRPPCCT